MRVFRHDLFSIDSIHLTQEITSDEAPSPSCALADPALAVFLVGAFSFDAEAKRLGGGKSFGRQSGNVTQRQATPPAAPSQATNPANAAGAGAAGAAARKPWAGMLGGLAAGLGLAWLAHSLGLGAGFGNILLIGLLVLAAMAVIGMLRRGARAARGHVPWPTRAPARPTRSARRSTTPPRSATTPRPARGTCRAPHWAAARPAAP
jgi:predicted lipid-binding transport protein (Tim44 family)